MTTPRLSCADSAFPRLSHTGALGVIRDLGLSAVDICVFPDVAHTPPTTVRADPAAAAEAVLQRLDGLVVADVFMILGAFDAVAINHPDAAVREESLSYFGPLVEFAHRLSAPGVTVLPGVEFGAGSIDEAAVQLQRRADIAGEASLRLAFEPHYESVVATLERTLELLERAPDVGLALDYSHFVFQGIPQDDIDVLIPHAHHLHLRQAGRGDMQLPVHEGAIDFPRLMRRLQDDGYDGYLALEYQWEEWLDCNRLDCISETATLRDLLLAT